MPVNSAYLTEIFASFQGEGIYAGERQVFLRFAGCNVACSYCDSPQALELPKIVKYEALAGAKKSELIPNPLEVSKLIELILALNKPQGINHSISLTGGEPLLQVEFLKLFLPELKKSTNLPIYLETNGTLPEYLSEVIDLIDIIAMDLKLPSATGASPQWKEHKKFLEIAYMKELFVKAVFTKETNIMEIDEAAGIVAGIDEKIPFVLQPVTPHGKISHRPGVEQMFAFHAIAKKKLSRVRVIPQMHKILGLL